MFKQLKNLFKIEYLLLFLVAFELFNQHHLVIFALFVYLVLKGRVKRNAFNQDFVLVLLWGMSYFVFGVTNYSILHIPALLCACLIGYSMTSDKMSVFRMLLVIGVGYGLEGLLMVYLNGGFVSFAEDAASRVLPSMWGGDRSFTAQDAILYVFSGVLIFILTKNDINWIWKVLAVLFELGFVYDSLRMASRSPLVYCPIIVLVSLLAYNSLKIKTKSLGLFMVIVFALFVAYQLNVMGIKSIFEDSLLFSRIENQDDGGMINNSRFRLHSNFIKVWDRNMWGGLNDELGYYFHNCWLDMYAFSGVFGFITFIILTIRCLRNFIYVYKRTDNDERSMWAGVFVAFILPMFFEPLYWGAPAFFAFFIVYYGMLSKRRQVLCQERMGYKVITTDTQAV